VIEAPQTVATQRNWSSVTLPAVLVTSGLSCLVAVYAIMVGTQRGRAVDSDWTARALPTPYPYVHPGEDFQPPPMLLTDQGIMQVLSPAHLLAVGVILVLVTLSTRRWRRALAMCVAASGLAVSAAILKLVLPRPGSGELGLANSFPSGHVAGAAAIAVALVLMTSKRWRWPALLTGIGLMAFSAKSAVSLQWHRPSDVAGAAFLAVSWYGIGLAVLRYRDWRRPGEPPEGWAG
jgi:membrane-associated phospholipid phosphatase